LKGNVRKYEIDVIFQYEINLIYKHLAIIDESDIDDRLYHIVYIVDHDIYSNTVDINICLSL